MIKNSFQIRKCPQYSIFQTRKRGKNYTIHFYTTHNIRALIHIQTGAKRRVRGRSGEEGRERVGIGGKRGGEGKGEKEWDRERRRGKKKKSEKIADFVTSCLKSRTYEIRFEFDNLFRVKSICRYLKNNDEGKNARDVATYCGNRRPIQVAGWNSSLQSRFLQHPHFDFTYELL